MFGGSIKDSSKGGASDNAVFVLRKTLRIALYPVGCREQVFVLHAKIQSLLWSLPGMGQLS